uniref:Putative secreted protein n=1 Tax=Anopheles darlingi TaxID=43151 RepID=A0A2M4D7K4_ANODA
MWVCTSICVMLLVRFGSVRGFGAGGLRSCRLRFHFRCGRSVGWTQTLRNWRWSVSYAEHMVVSTFSPKIPHSRIPNSAHRLTA